MLESKEKLALRRAELQSNPISEKARERARSKLWHLGWSPITVMGPHVARELGRQLEAGGGRRAHWRSGHWRNQAHGPAMSLRKLIWIWPTIVGASHVEDIPESRESTGTRQPVQRGIES